VYYLTARIQPASLYSMRLPYTHQSALTYPLPPPSTILGMLAAALQRAEDRPPLECLEEVEAGVESCAALVDEDTRIVARSCVVKLITDIKKGTTDALPRQFAHTHEIAIVAFAQSLDLLDRIAEALQRAPVTLGGSESLAAVSDVEIGEATVEQLEPGECISTRAYIPRDLLDPDSIGEHHSLFWVHERCLGAEELTAYLFPVTLAGSLYRTVQIWGGLAAAARRYAVGGDAVLSSI
jgi:CRISPR-associated Cas5-like protein